MATRFDRPRFAVIPTNGRACLRDCLDAIEPQVDATILIYTVDYKTDEIHPRGMSTTIRDLRDRNISRWWNQGLHVAAHGATNLTSMDLSPSDEWDVAVLNDDVIVPTNWFNVLVGEMRSDGSSAASFGARRTNWYLPGPVPLDSRLQGFAFLLAGEREVRANEEFRWYFSDDCLDWTARLVGGVTIVPGTVIHQFPNGQMDGELQVVCAEDAQKFKNLWGMMPW